MEDIYSRRATNFLLSAAVILFALSVITFTAVYVILFDTDCDPPPAISGGNVSVSQDGKSVTFTCDTGYSLNGDVTGTCLTDGTGWDVVPPTCG